MKLENNLKKKISRYFFVRITSANPMSYERLMTMSTDFQEDAYF